MIINKNEILKNIGIEFTDDLDYFIYMKQLIDYLEKHNKNYTNRQYQKIIEIKEILENIEIKGVNKKNDKCISDIIVEHWQEYVERDDFNIYDYEVWNDKLNYYIGLFNINELKAIIKYNKEKSESEVD